MIATQWQIGNSQQDTVSTGRIQKLPNPKHWRCWVTLTIVLLLITAFAGLTIEQLTALVATNT